MPEKTARIPRSAAWRAQFIEANGFRCHYCNRPGGPEVGPDARPWHVDHKDPLADGGRDEEENLALACKRCNIAKSDRPYGDFLAYARIAFWNEAPAQVSDADIDSLLEAWRGTPQGAWSYRVNRDEPRVQYVVSCRPAGEISSRVDRHIGEIFEGYGRYPWGKDVAAFLIHAHRVLPLLAAELRLLRAESTEAVTATQATTDAA